MRGNFCHWLEVSIAIAKTLSFLAFGSRMTEMPENPAKDSIRFIGICRAWRCPIFRIGIGCDLNAGLPAQRKLRHDFVFNVTGAAVLRKVWNDIGMRYRMQSCCVPLLSE